MAWSEAARVARWAGHRTLALVHKSMDEVRQSVHNIREDARTQSSRPVHKFKKGVSDVASSLHGEQYY